MKIFYLDKFDEDTLTRFIEFQNLHNDENQIIMVNCEGGVNWVYSQFLEILNFDYTKFELHITEACSNGFRLLLNFKGNIKILEGAFGMYHLTSTYPKLLVNGVNAASASSNYSEYYKKECNTTYATQLKECSKFMTEAQLKLLKEGKDIYFTEKELKNILHNKTKNKN